MGKHRRHPNARRILAAVQQRGSEENRVNTRARLLGNFTELCRIDPRPHRRIPRIHLQGCIRGHLEYLRPLDSIRPRQRADPFLYQQKYSLRREKMISNPSAPEEHTFHPLPTAARKWLESTFTHATRKIARSARSRIPQASTSGSGSRAEARLSS